MRLIIGLVPAAIAFGRAGFRRRLRYGTRLESGRFDAKKVPDEALKKLKFALTIVDGRE